MMPYDKDDEFQLFYDFSRAYRELPQKPMITAGDSSDQDKFTAKEERKIERNQRMANKDETAPIEANDSGSDDWEDIDCDDGEMEDVEEANEEEEESSEPSKDTSEASSEFVVVKSEENAEESKASFSIIDSKAQSSSMQDVSGGADPKTGNSSTFQLIGDSASSIAEDVHGSQETSSYSSAI